MNIFDGGGWERKIKEVEIDRERKREEEEGGGFLCCIRKGGDRNGK